MREILFRGKRTDNGEWVEGNYLHDPDLEAYQILGFRYYSSAEGLQREEFCSNVVPKTVGQCVGVEDENGEQIYEGDIVWYANDEEYGKVEWDKDTASYVVQFSTFVFDFDSLYGYELEIVGNIYDNPELLGGDDEWPTVK